MTETPLDHRSGVRHEKTDVEAAAIVRSGIILAVVTTLVAIGLVYLFRGFAGMEEAKEPPPAPLVHMEMGRVPPEPRLQTLPFADIERLRAEEAEALHGYGWVDEKAGVVRIPIESAMDLLAKRGLPVGAPSPAPPPPGKGETKR